MAIHKYQAFVKVAEMGSITKAAEAMGYTQSAVSRMVADLEDEWNLNLLRRSRGGLALSSDGLMLLPYIKDLCSHYEALQEQANSLKGLETGFIRIGSCSSFSTQCLPSILKNFEQRYPRIVFQLQNMEYSEAEEALCAGEIDCGFISAPYSPELDVTVLLRDKMLAVLPPSHPLAGKDAVTLDDIRACPIIMPQRGSDNDIRQVLDLERHEVEIRYVLNDDLSTLAMVNGGFGVSVMPRLIIESCGIELTTRPLDPPACRIIGIATPRGRRPTSLADAFIEFLGRAA